MFKYYNHLGFNNPYYIKKNGKFIIKSNISEVLDEFNTIHEVDPVAVIELFFKTYILGDRTIIKGVNKTPWIAKPNESKDDWNYDILPNHGQLSISEKEISKTLFNKLCDELKIYIKNYKKLGILLSGGMDSRMVAGSLDYLIKNNKLEPGIEVTALTWGNADSRDVVYAKEIANRLNWKWKHYTVTANDLLNNIYETAIHGCEYSPIDLHAIPQIRDDNPDLEVILAGSYGDSIGRAEYGGWKLKYLKPILNKIINFSGIINQEIFSNSIRHVKEDVNFYHNRFSEKENYAQTEMDYQLHYMRRRLNPCMALLNEKTKFYQLFSSPDVYGYMWSLDLDKRNDLIYKYMYDHFSTKLDDIPWARTGLPYGQKNGKPDNFKKDHHSYVKIIKSQLLENIISLIDSNDLKKLEIFDLKAIKRLILILRIFPSNNLFYYDKLILLASISKMVNLYKIKGLSKNKVKVSNNNFSIINHFYFRIRQSTAPILKMYFHKIFIKK